MSSLKLRAASWNRFITRGFGIEPDLLGAIHNFNFQGHEVSIRLPQQATLPFPEDRDAQATVFSWREENGEKIPKAIAVSSVDIVIKLLEEVEIPEEVLKVNLNAYEIIPKAEQAQLDTLGSNYGALAEQAFSFWIRMLRWKSNSSWIGRPSIQGSASGWGTYLFEPVSQKRFWSHHHPLTLQRLAVLDHIVWDEIEQTLQSGDEPPLSFDMMFDAIEYLRTGELQRAVVDMAVACEIFIRKLVMQGLPETLIHGLKTYIDEANIRTVITRFLREILSEDELKTLRGINSHLHKLFDSRNQILHSGTADNLTLEACNQYLAVTRSLIDIRP